MQNLIALFPDTNFACTLSRLAEIYNDLDEKITAWQCSGHLSCPEGCGTCCRTFEPHVHPAEAEYSALYIALQAPHLSTRPETFRSALYCVFFDETGPAHCTIYPARPLLCRLFAFSGVRDKQGQRVFRLCAHMPDIGPARQFTAESVLSTFGSYPPDMQEYSLQLETLSPGEVYKSEPLRLSLPAALDKVQWLYSLSQDR